MDEPKIISWSIDHHGHLKIEVEGELGMSTEFVRVPVAKLGNRFSDEIFPSAYDAPHTAVWTWRKMPDYQAAQPTTKVPGGRADILDQLVLENDPLQHLAPWFDIYPTE